MRFIIKLKKIMLPCLALVSGISIIAWGMVIMKADEQNEIPEEKTVTLMIKESRYSDQLKSMIKKVYVEYRIRVNVQVVPDEQGDSIVQMKAQTGTLTDMIDSNIPHVYGLINPPSYFEDLSDEPWVTRLKSPETVTYTDGRIYGFPFQENSGVAGIIYNKEVFEKYNLELPKTQQEFYTVCEKLKEEGVSPVMLCNDTWVPQMWMNYGFPLAIGDDEDCKNMEKNILEGNKKLSEYDELQKVIDTYLGMFQKGYINEDYLSISYDDMCERFINGQGAMMMGYSGMISQMENTYTKARIGMFLPVFTYIREDEVVCPEFSVGINIIKDSPNVDTAKELLNIWSQPEYLQMWFEGNEGFPAFEGVNGGVVNEDVQKIYQKYVASGKKVNEFMLYLQPLYALNSDKTWLYYMEAPYKGYDSETIINMMDEDIENYY